MTILSAQNRKAKRSSLGLRPAFSALFSTVSSAVFFASVIVWPRLAQAAEGSQGSGHHAGIGSLLPYVVNFTLYAFVMYFLLRKPFINGWATRRAAISEAVESGIRASATAEQLLREAEQRLQMVATRSEEIRAEIRREGSAESSLIVAEAKKRAARVVLQAQESAGAEKLAFERALRREVAESVVRRAEEKLLKEVGMEWDHGLRAASLRSVKSLIQ